MANCKYSGRGNGKSRVGIFIKAAIRIVIKIAIEAAARAIVIIAIRAN
jgi:hypothetical protein